MDIAVTAEGTLPVGKVVQLRPNGKATALPLDDVSALKPVYTSPDWGRTEVSYRGLRHIKLTDDYYLFAYSNGSTTPTYRITLALMQKNADGTFTKKFETVTSLRVSNASLNLIKISATQVVVTCYDTGAQFAIVTIPTTYDNLTVGSPSSAIMSGQSASPIYAWTKLKETGSKVIFLLMHTNGVGIHSFDKASGTITPQAYYNATWYTYSTQATDVYAKSPDKVVLAWAYANTNYYLAMQILDIVYSADGESVTAINPRTQAAQVGSSISTSYVPPWNGLHIDDEVAYLFHTSGSDGSLTLLLTSCKINWSKMDATAFTILQTSVTVANGLNLPVSAGTFIDPDTNEYFVVTRPSSGTNIGRLYVYSDGCKFGADIRMSAAKRAYDMAPINTTNMANLSVSYSEGELFLAYYLTTTPNVAVIEKLAQVSDKPVPLGIAKSQSTVTIKGTCNGLENIEVGAAYFFDKFGNITRNPSDTYLGVGTSPTSILIDKTLF